MSVSFGRKGWNSSHGWGRSKVVAVAEMEGHHSGYPSYSGVEEEEKEVSLKVSLPHVVIAGG
ncbi:hypothetical protein BP00DRAFT_431326 [Aspergillus indologenus CBS 114.80]|uniref:Uncharacterized protein n=1 Tax=Aspergillus indologenus CBS 114.80 TaxID=1450541 RepID=A0A2V5HRT3_9EURO|nr:hypothetical protein BP00DRAFT_431326 [Aspergillus indologenus CBS 114.80]